MNAGRSSRLAVDPERLRAFLAARLNGFGGDEPLTIERVGAGRSNLTYMVSSGDRRYILRRPPPGPLPPTAHDVLREYEMLQRLARTPVRVPEPVLSWDDESVIGAPFYLMEYVDGFVVRDSVPDELGTTDSRRSVCEELIEVLAEIHALDWTAAGLARFSRPTGYLDRQLRRWRSQWRHNRTREILLVEQLYDWLVRRKPTSEHISLVHGDFKLDNLMFSRSPPPRCVAVVDWEMATVGDPLADLGYLFAFWLEEGDREPGPLAIGAATAATGFLTREELRVRYERCTGFSTRDLAWYEVLALWKLAILFEAMYKRYVTGGSDDPFDAELETGVPLLLERALARTR